MGKQSNDETVRDAFVPDSASAESLPSRKKRRKAWMAAGVLVTVVVVAGVGLWIWHEQPSFCATVCHDTMSPYLESYENEAYLACDHAKQGVSCLDCHTPTLSDQISELQKQVSGDYRIPLAKRDFGDEFCLRDGCHTRESIASETEEFQTENGDKVNPHTVTILSQYSASESPHDQGGETLACATCHASHRSSDGIDYCFDACHHTKTFQTCYECHDHR